MQGTTSVNLNYVRYANQAISLGEHGCGNFVLYLNETRLGNNKSTAIYLPRLVEAGYNEAKVYDLFTYRNQRDAASILTQMPPSDLRNVSAVLLLGNANSYESRLDYSPSSMQLASTLLLIANHSKLAQSYQQRAAEHHNYRSVIENTGYYPTMGTNTPGLNWNWVQMVADMNIADIVALDMLHAQRSGDWARTRYRAEQLPLLDDLTQLEVAMAINIGKHGYLQEFLDPVFPSFSPEPLTQRP